MDDIRNLYKHLINDLCTINDTILQMENTILQTEREKIIYDRFFGIKKDDTVKEISFYDNFDEIINSLYKLVTMYKKYTFETILGEKDKQCYPFGNFLNSFNDPYKKFLEIYFKNFEKNDKFQNCSPNFYRFIFFEDQDGKTVNLRNKLEHPYPWNKDVLKVFVHHDENKKEYTLKRNYNINNIKDNIVMTKSEVNKMIYEVAKMHEGFEIVKKLQIIKNYEGKEISLIELNGNYEFELKKFIISFDNNKLKINSNKLLYKSINTGNINHIRLLKETHFNLLNKINYLLLYDDYDEYFNSKYKRYEVFNDHCDNTALNEFQKIPTYVKKELYDGNQNDEIFKCYIKYSDLVKNNLQPALILYDFIKFDMYLTNKFIDTYFADDFTKTILGADFVKTHRYYLSWNVLLDSIMLCLQSDKYQNNGLQLIDKYYKVIEHISIDDVSKMIVSLISLMNTNNDIVTEITGRINKFAKIIYNCDDVVNNKNHYYTLYNISEKWLMALKDLLKCCEYNKINICIKLNDLNQIQELCKNESNDFSNYVYKNLWER